MTDFEFLENPVSKKWVILAPRRAKRPDVAKGPEPVCPFCPGKESQEQNLYVIPNSNSSHAELVSASRKETRSRNKFGMTNEQVQHDNVSSDWLVRVVPNKFPFASIHEIIIHSPDHQKNFGELSKDHVQLILQTYGDRYNGHKDKGQVYIFHNRGEAAGESLPHPHTQLAVLPFEVKTDIPRLDPVANVGIGPEQKEQARVETTYFYLFCPKTSQWPDEVWVAPKARGRAFGEITNEEIADLADILTRLVRLLNIRHRNEFPFNFYIYPGGDWYLRIIPRLKSLGGFEIGTGVFINTQDPKDTMNFIKDHFDPPAGGLDEEKIKENLAEYHKHV